MKRKILYYYQQPAGDFLPSLKRIYFHRIIVSEHVKNLKLWALELGFKNAQICFANFIKPSLYCYNAKFKIWQFWKLGGLKSFNIRLGKRLLTVSLTKADYNRRIDNLQKDALPNDFYEVQTNGENSYQLFFNYDFDDNHKAVKLKLPVLIQEYDTTPNRREIYRQIMLNDGYRWRKAELKEGEKLEISERVYYFLLNCMPPRRWIGNYFEVGECDHHDEKGVAVHRACHCIDGKFYTGHTGTISKLRPQQPTPLQ